MKENEEIKKGEAPGRIKIPENPVQIEEYIFRINRVIDYIDKSLSKELTLEELADVANFSKFHFHRIFNVFIGETLGHFISRLRLEKAAYLLVSQLRLSVTEIALDTGFSGSSSFSRSFKNFFGMSPSVWRKEKSNLSKEQSNLSRAESKNWKDLSLLSRYNLDIKLQRRKKEMDKLINPVEIKDFEKCEVAYVRHIGPYKGDGELFQRLINKLFAWAGPKDLLKEVDGLIFIYHDNPEVTDENKLRVSICMKIPKGTQVDGDIGNIGKMEIPEGKYGVGRFKVKVDEYQEIWNYMYGEWLPSSGYVPDDRPCFEYYPEKSPDKDGKATVDIYVPVKPMVPVKPVK